MPRTSRRAARPSARPLHMKRILKLDRFRLRGLSGARNEVLLTATAQNLRRLAQLSHTSAQPGTSRRDALLAQLARAATVYGVPALAGLQTHRSDRGCVFRH